MQQSLQKWSKIDTYVTYWI